ncbi:hypothetical protein AB0D11_42840 [Streptomyces monashensis]|uniref:hypothetical protein n=1 Tax=Streptomyces monashensis TaxID=1678012 RepID=UPI0033C5B385
MTEAVGIDISEEMVKPSFFPTATGIWGFLPEDVHDLLLPHMTQPKEGDGVTSQLLWMLVKGQS